VYEEAVNPESAKDSGRYRYLRWDGYCAYAQPVNALSCQFVWKREEFPHVLLPSSNDMRMGARRLSFFSAITSIAVRIVAASPRR
jgi:hypothetical protein